MYHPHSQLVMYYVNNNYGYQLYCVTNLSIFSSSEKPTRFELQEALKSIDDKWLDFGLGVGFERRRLNKMKGDENPMSLVIDDWWRGNVPDGKRVSWKSVVEILQGMDEFSLAKETEKKYIHHDGRGTYVAMYVHTLV